MQAKSYEAYPQTFMLFCRQVLTTDFKAMHRVQFGEAPQLLQVGESGEFKRGTLGESKESYKVVHFHPELTRVWSEPLGLDHGASIELSRLLGK